MDLLDFLGHSPLSFHAAANIVHDLQTCGYEPLSEKKPWKLIPGGKYFISRNLSSVIVFTVPESKLTGFDIALSHLDSPGLRLKCHSLCHKANTLVAPVERYSKNIDSTWLDHPLTVAGRVVTTDLQEHLICFPEPMAVIPNLAIHLNREVNKGTEYNPQTQLSALFGNITPEDFVKAVASLVGCSASDIADMELGLADASGPTIVGLKHDLIVSSRLDNLLAAHAMLSAFCNKASVNSKNRCAIGFFADNEEIGSGTPQGANSSFLRDALERIIVATNGSREDFFIALAESRIVSVDAAHAYHPNYPEKYDATTSPMINGGVVLKKNANGSYATNAVTATMVMNLCESLNIPIQHFLIRSDMPCGSTVGPMTARLLGIPAADIGNAMWAMHSVRETAGIQDQKWMTALLSAFLTNE